MNTVMTPVPRLPLALLALRVGVTLAMAVWVLDKFVNPAHGAAVLERFYFMPGVGTAAIQVLGALQAVILLGFALGFQKRITYGLVLLMHAASTLSSFPVYLTPWAIPNILFWAAWPMLAAILALYLLRDQDTLLTASGRA